VHTSNLSQPSSPRRQPRGWAAAWLLVALAGCASAHHTTADDGGDALPDAGPSDATLLDATRIDAGAPDADTPTPDAGTLTPDAGTLTPDAGTPTPDAGSAGAVRGSVQYEDRPIDASGTAGVLELRPARAVAVDLLGSTGTVLATGTTDDAGRFELPYTTAPGMLVTVRARAEVSYLGHGGRVLDRRGRGNVYALVSTPFDGSAGVDLALVARASGGLGGAFNIADVLYSAFLVYAASVGTPAPRLTVQWQAGLAWTCGSCYSGDVISLGGQVADTDEYDDGIILHEMGHYFADHYSRDTSPGGSHRDRQVEPELAYGEGLGYFFACLVQGHPLVVDTYATSSRLMEFEDVTLDGVSRTDFVGTSTGAPDGSLREEIVAAILWDAFDGVNPAEPFDRVALGVDGMLALLVDYFGTWPHPDQGAPGIDLSDLLYALVCSAGVPAADAEALANDRGFPWAASPCGP
jgi:hypothetical protein